MRFQGRIVEWHDDRGFGFVSPNGREERAFLHVKSFTRRGRRPVGNELVTFAMVQDAKGKFRAENVAFVVLGAKSASASGPGNWRAILAALFLLAVATLYAYSRIPVEIVGIYLVASTITFVAYVLDKSAARSGGQRTQESALQVMSLLGGWPGGLFGQQLMRHKTRKVSFQQTFWFSVAANLLALIFVLTSQGGRFLTELLGR